MGKYEVNFSAFKNYMRNAITLNWNRLMVGSLCLEEDDIVSDDASADAGFALLVGDLTV